MHDRTHHAPARRSYQGRVAERPLRRQGPDHRTFAYGDAVRHSTRVRLLRRVLPATAATILVLVAAIAWIDPLRLVRELPIDLLKLSISGNKLVMDAPKLSGFTKDGRGYNISAKSAAQDLTKMNVIEMTDITANFIMTDKGTTELLAANGFYDAKADIVHLTNGIKIKSTSGFEGQLTSAFIEVKKGHVVSEDPVDIIFNNGTLRSDRLEISENGARAMFEGRVTMMVRLPPPSETQTAAPPVPNPSAAFAAPETRQ